MCGCPSDNVLKIGNNGAIFLELRANNRDSADWKGGPCPQGSKSVEIQNFEGEEGFKDP